MEKRLTEKYDIVFEAEDAEGENVPVALQNGKFGAAGEGVLAAFGLPGKGEIDPSMIMTACYVFSFRTDAVRRSIWTDRLCSLSGEYF
mgnify:CR=1 FL=1